MGGPVTAPPVGLGPEGPRPRPRPRPRPSRDVKEMRVQGLPPLCPVARTVTSPPAPDSGVCTGARGL